MATEKPSRDNNKFIYERRPSNNNGNNRFRFNSLFNVLFKIMTINNLKKKIIDRWPKLQRWVKYNFGLIPEDLKPEDYIFGGLTSLTKKILQPSGQWLDFLPSEEKQQGRRVETMACTCFSCLNVLEMLAKKRDFGDWNKSDRFTAKLSGTSYNGNLQSRVLDSVRKVNGSVDESLWPANIDEFSWSEFYATVPKAIQDKGLIFVNDYEVGFEAVWSTANALKEALKYSPLYVAGFAWAESGGLYRSYGSANHAFTLVGYKDGEYWLAFDSYFPYIKKLAWNYSICFPKVITLNKRGASYNANEIKNLMNRGLAYIMRVMAAGEIYKLDTDKLTYISPEEWNNLNVELSADQKKLVGVSEEFFNRLLI